MRGTRAGYPNIKDANIMVYRLSYLRGNTLRGVTFSAADILDALRFQELWESVTDIPVLDMKPLGPSKFSPRRKR